MAQKTKLLQAQNPLILRCHRLMECFAKSDDERDFYLDRTEGFLLYADLDKPEEDLAKLQHELAAQSARYISIPKMTFYETKKIMEGFVNEKVYDIDTKEKLLEIIQSKEARENFLEFIYDHHHELDKWQQYYQERSRIRIIEWLRTNHFEFVFEEDLELPKESVEKLKIELFETKASKDLIALRKALIAKSKSYYSSEALNPRPKRGRPPKQVAKTEVEPQMTGDIFTTVPTALRQFLFTPPYNPHNTLMIFSQKFDNEEQMLARKKPLISSDLAVNLETLNQKLSAIRHLSSRWAKEDNPLAPKQNSVPYEVEEEVPPPVKKAKAKTPPPPPKKTKAAPPPPPKKSKASPPPPPKKKSLPTAKKSKIKSQPVKTKKKK
jgi:hypothetical protein